MFLVEYLRKILLLFLFLIFFSKEYHFQNIIINELSPNKTTGFIDEYNNPSPWIEILNNTGSYKNLKDYSLSNDIKNLSKWKFPSIPLKTDQYFTIYLSNFSKLTPLFWKTIIDLGDEWNYFIGLSEPPENWISPEFIDSNWNVGKSGFGYGDSDDSTKVGKTMSVYIRKSFQIKDIENAALLALNVDYDDGFIAYLNGVEVARANIGAPGFTPKFDDLADNSDHEANIYRNIKPETFIIKYFKNLVKTGENILCVQVHNGSTSSVDLTIIPILSIALFENDLIDMKLSNYVPDLPSGIHAELLPNEFQDTVFLSDPNGRIIDKIEYSNLPLKYSIGKSITDVENILIFEKPTPGTANTTIGKYYFLFSESILPIISINTNGQTILDEEKINAQMGIINNSQNRLNKVTDAFNDFDGNIGIELRGTTSQSFPKKQFSIETRDSNNSDENFSLLNLPKEEDWILHAPYSDKTLIRNALEYSLSNKIGRYASRAKFCELVLNGEYQGVYVLMEKIKRDKNRVDISKLDSTDIEGDDLTGGYIIKIDNITGSSYDGWHSGFPTNIEKNRTIYFQYHYPGPEDIIDVQKNYIQKYFHDFEYSLSSSSFKDPVKGYRKYIDVDSFIDHMILVELSKNVDGYRLSTFLYKDKNSNDSLIKIGPVWDYNIALGNVDYDDGQNTEGWQFNWHGGNEYTAIPFWWKRLLEDEYFINKLKIRWLELRKSILSNQSIFFTIDSLVDQIGSDQIKRNFERWPILDEYVWPNAIYNTTYAQEIKYLKNWIEKRLKWLDANMPGNISEVALSIELNLDKFGLEQNYPNPFNPTTKIKYQIPSVITRSEAARQADEITLGNSFTCIDNVNVSLAVYDILGREIATLVNQKQKPGNYEVEWNADDLPCGVYLYKIKAGDFTEVKKMILLK